MKRPVSGDRSGEDGYVIALGALLIVPLMIAVGFAVDLGSWFAQATHEQTAADAASLAGVIYLPDEVRAEQEARKIAAQNGYCDATSRDDPAVACTNYNPDVTIVVTRVTGEQQLDVQISDAADLFFAGVVLGDFNITRDAVAEYVSPVPLGSPFEYFGNDPTDSNKQPGFWSAIQGPHTEHQHGDPFATECSGGITDNTTCNPAGVQADFRMEGYLYAVDVPETAVLPATLTVQIYDAPCYTSNNADPPDTGAQMIDEWCDGNIRTRYELYHTNGVNVSPSTTNSLRYGSGGGYACSSGGGPGSRTFATDQTPASSFRHSWWTLCSVTITEPGIYPLRVRSSNGGGWDGRGFSVYSLRSSLSTGGDQPQLYGLNDFSIWSPDSGGRPDATFYLAEVGPEHAGKRFLVDMFDPGDGRQGYEFQMSLLGPGDSAPASSSDPVVSNYTCMYTNPGGASANWQTDLVSSTSTNPTGDSCTFRTKTTTQTSGNAIYNDRWVRAEFQLPSDYTCTEGSAGVNGCWWRVYYNFQAGGSCPPSDNCNPTERTVWRARVVGDPVHLVD